MGQTREGGLYYVGGVAVDANGQKVEDAPERQPDTPFDVANNIRPTGVPGMMATAAFASGDTEQRIADGIAAGVAAALKALGYAPPVVAPHANSSSDPDALDSNKLAETDPKKDKDGDKTGNTTKSTAK